MTKQRLGSRMHPPDSARPLMFIWSDMDVIVQRCHSTTTLTVGQHQLYCTPQQYRDIYISVDTVISVLISSCQYWYHNIRAGMTKQRLGSTVPQPGHSGSSDQTSTGHWWLKQQSAIHAAVLVYHTTWHNSADVVRLVLVSLYQSW